MLAYIASHPICWPTSGYLERKYVPCVPSLLGFLDGILFHLSSTPRIEGAPSRVSGQLITITGRPVQGKIIDFRINLVGPIQSDRTDANGFFAGELSAPLAEISVPDGSDHPKIAPIGWLYVLPGATIDLGSISFDNSTINKPQARLRGPIRLVELPQRSTANAGKIAALVIACSGPVQDYCDRNTLTVIHGDGSAAEPIADKNQIRVSSPMISEDGSTAGWLANEPFCCTSYPIATRLAVYIPTKPLRMFNGDGRAIFKWKFIFNGEQVAFYHDFLHGTPAQHYELRDVSTGRLISKWDGELTGKASTWTKGL